MKITQVLAEPSGSASTVSRRRGLLWGPVYVVLGSITTFVVLAVLGPMVLPYRTYAVRTGSMRPTIPVGALAVYFPVAAEEIRTGDVVAFNRPGGDGEMVTHRVVRVERGDGETSFVTQGDANGQPDDWRVPASGRGWRYAFSIPRAGFALGMVGSAAARRIVLMAAVLVVGALLLVWIWRRPDARSSKSTVRDRDEVGAVGLSAAAVECLADQLSVVLGHSQLLCRTIGHDDPRRVDAVAITQAAQRAAGALRALGVDAEPSAVEPVADSPDRLQAHGPASGPLDLLADTAHVLRDRARVLPR